MKRKATKSPQGGAAGVLSQRSASGLVLAFALDSRPMLEPRDPSQLKEVFNAEAVDGKWVSPSDFWLVEHPQVPEEKALYQGKPYPVPPSQEH